MRRSTLVIAPVATLLALGVVFPGIATATPAPKTMSFTASSYTVAENAGHVTVTIQRPASTTRATVRLTTSDGTAVAPGDYTHVSRTMVFPGGRWYYHHTTISYEIPIVDNAVANADKTFTVSLSRPSGGYQLASPSTATVTIVNDDVPAAPAGLTATPVGSDEIDLGWTANSDYTTGYRVLRSTTSGGPYTQVGTSTTNSYQDTGLAAGTYYYVVQAVDPAGNSPSSGEASTTVPAAPTELIYNGGFENGLTSGWYVSSGSGYSITLDSSDPHGGTYSAHLATDGSQAAYPTMEGSFTMPSSGTVTFTAWYKAALASSATAFISLYDDTAPGYLSSQNLPSAADWTEITPVTLDASALAGHYILIVVNLQVSGPDVSTMDVDDFSALVG